MKSKAWIAAASLVASCIFGHGVAHALPEYPQKLEDATMAPCLPHCNICHRDDNAGGGTVDQPFIKSLESVGRFEDGNFSKAVARLKSAGTDSDGDGASDIDEIERGDDPNNAYDARICGPEVGCSVASTTDANAGTLGAMLVLLAFVIGQRARLRPRI